MENEKIIVRWEDRYTLGIELIDNQHKELVNLINHLYEACLTGNESIETTFKDAMSHMVEYVKFHFSAELEILGRVNYPDLDEHKKQHDTLVVNILEAAKDYAGGKKYAPNNFVRTLRDWVMGHIAVSDKQYAKYIHEQNLLSSFA